MGQEPTGKSQWIYPDASGKLVYKTTKKGDRIIDFSHAGYKGGGVTLPYVPAKLTVHPLGENEDCRKYRGKIGKVIKNYAKDLEEDLKNSTADKMMPPNKGKNEGNQEAIPNAVR